MRMTPLRDLRREGMMQRNMNLSANKCMPGFA